MLPGIHSPDGHYASWRLSWFVGLFVVHDGVFWTQYQNQTKAQQQQQQQQKVPPSKTEDFEKDVLARMRKIAEERKKEKADAAAAQA